MSGLAGKVIEKTASPKVHAPQGDLQRPLLRLVEIAPDLEVVETRRVLGDAKPRPSDPLRAAFDSLPSKVTHANLRLLPRNVDAWMGMWHVLATAPDGIDASYFILERDVFGMSFLGGLLKKAMEKKRVRLLIDSAGDLLRR